MVRHDAQFPRTSGQGRASAAPPHGGGASGGGVTGGGVTGGGAGGVNSVSSGGVGDAWNSMERPPTYSDVRRADSGVFNVAYNAATPDHVAMSTLL